MKDLSEEVVSSATQNRRRAVTPAATISTRGSSQPTKKSLPIERVFSSPNIHPFDQIEWERRTAEIADDSGKVIFKQDNVEVPKFWSVLATKVVVSKYFYAVILPPFCIGCSRICCSCIYHKLFTRAGVRHVRPVPRHRHRASSQRGASNSQISRIFPWSPTFQSFSRSNYCSVYPKNPTNYRLLRIFLPTCKIF